MPKQEARVEKVKLRDVVSNPFSDIPLNEDAVSQLITQFRSVGYHARPIGRKRKDGKVEVASAHHRVEALRQTKGGNHEIEIEISDLSDEKMIKEMAGDNDFSFNLTMRKFDAAVKAARDYLRAHPEEQQKTLFSETQEDKPERVRLGAPMIAKFLNKKKLSQVRLAVERVNAIEDGVVNPEALYLMPSANVADIFIEVLKKFSRLDKKLHVPFAKIINEQHAYSRNSMERALALGGLGVYHGEVYDRDYGFNTTFKNLSGTMYQLLLTLHYLPAEVNNFFSDDKRKISDVVRLKDLNDFRANVIGLRNHLESIRKYIESKVPAKVWTQEEVKLTVKQYKAFLARTKRLRGKNVILHPGQLRKDFGLHKKKEVKWGRFYLWQVEKMIKQGLFYYKPDPASG